MKTLIKVKADRSFVRDLSKKLFDAAREMEQSGTNESTLSLIETEEGSIEVEVNTHELIFRSGKIEAIH